MQTKTFVAVAAVVAIVVVAVAALAFYLSELPSPANQNVLVVNENTNQPLIGGQKDAHGCLIAAGYSWCESKQKCLRVWEEECYAKEEAALTEIFSSKHNQLVTETNVTIVVMENNFASGTVSFGETAGEGGEFLARLADNAWIIDFEGNGSIDCPKIQGLGYPQEVLEGFCDEACTQEAKICPDGSSVVRTGPDCEFAPCPGKNKPALSEAEARAIAEESCIKGGEALEARQL